MRNENQMIHDNKWHSIVALLVLWMIALSVQPCSAQNNPYKIKDNLYAIYQRAVQYRRVERGLYIADTLYAKAVAQKDAKAQCLALTIPLIYHFYQPDNEAGFERSVKLLQEMALKTGYMQYYYYAASNDVNYWLNRKMYYKALLYVKDVQAFARKHNHPYGIYSGYRMLAQIYSVREEYGQAIASYKEALAYGTAHLPDQDMSQNYRNLARCYHYTGEYEKMLQAVNKGLSIIKAKQNISNLYMMKAYAEFQLGKYVEFRQTFAKVKKLIGEFGHTSMLDYDYLLCFNLLDQHKYDEAMKFIESKRDESGYLTMLLDYYRYRGQYDKAYDALDQIRRRGIYNHQETFKTDMMEVNALFNNQRLENEKQRIKYENTKLQLSNTQLTLENSSLELGRAQAAERMARLDANNMLLSFNNKQLEANKLRDSLKMQAFRRAAQEKAMQTHNTILMILLGAALLLIVSAASYIVYRHRANLRLQHLNTHLHQANIELGRAKDKAVQADKMKTMFIQNMSHEIRTPLNAIVGFSQLITDPAFEVGKEERSEMGKRIKENSDLLLTLINDILDMTALESGRYVMQMADVNVNEICRMALATVDHRKAPGVELRFTSDVDNRYTVHTDSNRVRQVLINLLTNAEKNTTEGSITLHCSLLENPGQLTFIVTDTGIGIPKDKMDEIFERFKKLDNFKQGSGLGLNICRVISEKLGGRIYIDKEYTGGARFCFAIAMRPDEPVES